MRNSARTARVGTQQMLDLRRCEQFLLQEARLLGEADAYMHSGPMKEWDSAAPVAVAAKAGLWISDLAGEPLVFNKPSRLTDQLLICHPSLTDRLLEAYQPAG